MNIFADFISDHLGLVGFLIIFLFAAWRVWAKESQNKIAKKILEKAVSTGTHEPLTLHPEIDPLRCAGCASCTKVCPEGDILKIIDHRAVLVAPTKCIGHGECEQSCPTGAIKLVFGTKTRGMEIPRITKNYETNVPGLYIAGELGGMGLIRNAIKQGNLAATHALENLNNKAKTDTDLLIVGAGPAGLSAALTTIVKNKTYICIEQNSFGGTVFNFPRQKIVSTHPVDLPGFGKMKFPKNQISKEELLEFWQEVKKIKKLKVAEAVKFDSLEAHGSHFTVTTSTGIVTAKKVILCMGVRGSPRKLGLPNEDLPKVAYNLVDAEQYQNRQVVVVGGGNAGVEAAQQLGEAKYGNEVSLLVRGPTLDRCNDTNKEKIESMASQGLVKILYNSSVKEIHADRLEIEKDKEALTLKNDFLFIFAGAEMPQKFLMSLGIKIEKRFGTRL